ncbi:MAG: PAS domain S-box protein, partial [Bacteroidota bacterium]|nr:PAS domain S-box protein [Bacteroidota bacterium]
MNEIRKFAGFIREVYAEAVIRTQSSLLQQAPFSGIAKNDESVYEPEYLLRSLVLLLAAIEEGGDDITVPDKESLFLIDYRSQADSSNFENFFHTQKLALLDALPFYTKNVEIAIEVAKELDRIYFGLQKEVDHVAQNRKAVEDLPVESEEHYKDLFDQAHDLIHVLEPDGKVLFVNKAWMNSLHYEMDEITGKSIYDFVHEDGRELFIQYRNALLKKEIADKEILVPFRTKKGDKIFLEGFVSPRFQGGRAAYTRGIFRDVTAKMKNEQDLRFYIAQLGEREENLKLLVDQAPDA